MVLRIGVYNVEWFDDWFEPDNTLSPNNEAKIAAFGRIMRAIDPDILGIVEGPNTTSAGKSTVVCLEALAAHLGLRQSRATIGFASRGRQEIAALFDPARADLGHEAGGRRGAHANPRFDEEFRADADRDGIDEFYRHYRPPLELTVTRHDGGPRLRLIVVHMKSKGIFDNMDFVHWQRESERNRRKLFAEASHVRLRVEERLDAGDAVIVMGDINDGPEMDAHEMKFGRSAVELVMGDLFAPDRVLHAHCGRPKWGRFGWSPSSARFKDQFTGDPVNVLIDHILSSGNVAVAGDRPHRIWNPWEDDEAKPLKKDLRAVSDHFPITLDLA